MNECIDTYFLPRSRLHFFKRRMRYKIVLLRDAQTVRWILISATRIFTFEGGGAQRKKRRYN